MDRLERTGTRATRVSGLAGAVAGKSASRPTSYSRCRPEAALRERLLPAFRGSTTKDSVDSGLRADLVIASSGDSCNVNSDRTVGCCGPGQLGQLGQRPCSVSKRGAQPRHSRQCHRKISSARDASDCGMTSPCTFALARFRARANLIGCSTGVSAGLLPRKIRSTNSAARRNWSFGSTE